MRYREDYEQGKVGSTVHSRSGWDLPPHRPKKIFNRDDVAKLREQGASMRQIARRLGIGVGTVVRMPQEPPKDSWRPFENMRVHSDGSRSLRFHESPRSSLSRSK